MSERDEITKRWEFEVARLKGGYERQIADLRRQLAEARRTPGPATAKLAEVTQPGGRYWTEGTMTVREWVGLLEAFAAEHEPAKEGP